MSHEIEIDVSVIRTLHAIDASKWIGEGLAFWGEWNHERETPKTFTRIIEELQEQRWEQFIKPGSTSIDIGTHSGDTTVAMGLFSYDKINRNKGLVVAVEPNPDIHPLIKACLSLNGHIANFVLETCAITECDMTEVVLSDHGNSNCNGGIIGDLSEFLKSTLEQTAKITYTAPGKSLQALIDNSCGADRYGDILFIKTDCEGYDKQIIKGSKSILEQIKPVLFVEWFAWFTPEDDDAFFAAIDETGYVPLHPITLEPIDRLQRVSDVTCVHKSRLFDIRP